MKHTGFIYNGATPFRKDCTVRAIATVTGKDYMEVFLTFAEAGRKANQGFHIYDWLKSNSFTAFGCWFEAQPLGARGTFLVGNYGHIWAVINGVMHDSYQSGRRYKFCYQVHKLSEAEAAPTKHEQQAKALINATLQD